MQGFHIPAFSYFYFLCVPFAPLRLCGEKIGGVSLLGEE
jgi:hypothetical protein